MKLEPNAIESGRDVLTLMLQTDSRGETGDVRDIIISRQDIDWEIGAQFET